MIKINIRETLNNSRIEMIKSQTMFEIIRGERRYEFFCSPESPLGEIYDVLIEMENYIVNHMKQIEEQKKQVAEAPKE